MDAYFAERANQPFGDTELVSGQTRSRFSKGKQAAADNLLAKADRALAAGDQERVRLLVDRAAALAYDEHEETASRGPGREHAAVHVRHGHAGADPGG